jgi:hypothetical protein
MLDAAQCDAVEEDHPPCVEPGAADEQRGAHAAKIAPIDFFKEMFAHTSGPVYFCSLSNVKNDPEQPPERRVITRMPLDIRLFTSKWDRKGRALYFGVGALKQGAQERNKGTIAETAFLHADIDFKHVDGLPDDAAGKLAEVLRHLARLKYLPSATVFSGNGVHAYWRLTEPLPTQENIERIEAALKLLADHLAGDRKVCGVQSLMRLPGSHNTKNGAWTEVEIMSFNPERQYELDDLQEWLTEAAPVMRRKDGDPEPTKENDPFSDYAAREGVKRGKTDEELLTLLKQSRATPGKGWREPMLKFIGSTVAKGWSDLAIKVACAPYSDGGVDDPEIQYEIDYARKKFDKPHPDDCGEHEGAAQRDTGDAGAAHKVAVDPVDLWGNFEPPSLPRGLLPDVLERFAHDQGMDMGADMSGLAMSALAVCAAAIPDNVQLQVKRHNKGWLESARLWVALVGPPSSKKTPIMAAAARPLRKIDAAQAREHAEQRAAYERLSKEEKVQAEPPKQVRSVLQDTTIEAAQDVLKDSPDGLLCYQDELSGWFGAMDKYSAGRGSAKDRAFWLEAFNGGSYSVQRVGRGSVFIENLSVSLIGGIQPEPIRQIADDSVDDGLLQRLLPITLATAVVGRDEAATPVVAEYAELINRLHFLGEALLRFDDGAQRYRQELEEKHLKLQSFECVHRKLAAHIGKYDGIFARLCVIWHCIENAPAFGDMSAVVVSEKTARRAGAFLHGFLLPHAIAFYAGVLGLANDHDSVAAVAGYILAHGLTRITNRDLKRGDRTMRRLGSNDALAVFEQLEAFGWLERVPSRLRGGPPHWLVNPAVHQKFAERAKAEANRRAEVRQTIIDVLGRGVEP